MSHEREELPISYPAVVRWGDEVVRKARQYGDRPTPEPQGEAVAWQYRFELKDTGYWSGWAQAESAEALQRTLDQYTTHGFKAEGRELYTRPQPGEGGGEVTDEMVERAYEAWRKAISADHVLNRDAIRAALTAALSKGGQGG